MFFYLPDLLFRCVCLGLLLIIQTHQIPVLQFMLNLSLFIVAVTYTFILINSKKKINSSNRKNIMILRTNVRKKLFSTKNYTYCKKT